MGEDTSRKAVLMNRANHVRSTPYVKTAKSCYTRLLRNSVTEWNI